MRLCKMSSAVSRVLGSVLNFAKALGLLPIGYSSSNAQYFKTSALYKYSMLVQVLNYVFDLIKFWEIIVTTFKNPHFGASQILHIVGYCILHLCTICALLFLVRETGRIINILNKFKRVERLVPLTTTSAACLVHFYLLIHLTINLSYTIYYVFVSDDWDTTTWEMVYLTIMNVFVFLKYMSVSVLAMMFISFVILNRAFLHAINAELSHFRLEKKSLVRAEQLRLAIRTLTEVAEEVEAIFGHHTLLALTLINVYLQEECYTVLVWAWDNLIMQQQLSGHGRNLHIYLALGWILLDFLKAFAYFRESELAVHESSRTVEFLIKVSTKLEHQNIYRETVVWFASEVATHRASFTAHGLFNIDLQLFFAAAGTVATNMAILMQSHFNAG